MAPRGVGVRVDRTGRRSAATWRSGGVDGRGTEPRREARRNPRRSTVRGAGAADGDRGDAGRSRRAALARLRRRTWRGLAGLDVEQAPGPLALTVTGDTRSRARRCRARSRSTCSRRRSPSATSPCAPRFVDPPESERPRIEREAVRLHAIYDTVSTARPPGLFVPPVPHRRGARRSGRGRCSTGRPRDRHAGLDFASPAGAVIRAPAAGRVALVAPLYFTGNTVVLDHGYGVYSILAHMQRTLGARRPGRRAGRASGHGRGDRPGDGAAPPLVGAARRRRAWIRRPCWTCSAPAAPDER